MNFLRRLFFNIWYYQSGIFQTPPWDTGISPPELINYLESHTPGLALDLGCGTGTNVITMAEYGWQVTGVDFVRRAISKARDKAIHAGSNFPNFVSPLWFHAPAPFHRNWTNRPSSVYNYLWF